MVWIKIAFVMSWNARKDLDRSVRYTNQMQNGMFHWAASPGLHPHSQNAREHEDYTLLAQESLQIHKSKEKGRLVGKLR